MSLSENYSIYTEELLSFLHANVSIKKFTHNTDVIGAFAETSLREFLNRQLNPIKVATGTIIRPAKIDPKKGSPQLDSILYYPFSLPPLMEQDGFAIVPDNSAIGVIEIKRSAYSNVGKSIEEKKKVCESLLKRAIASVKFPGGDRSKQPQLTYETNKNFLGIVCIREWKSYDTKLDDLIEKKDAIVLLEENEQGEFKVNVGSAITLCNFLVEQRKIYLNRFGKQGLDENIPNK